MTEPIVTAEQVRECAESASAAEFAHKLNALFAPTIAERERVARLNEAEQISAQWLSGVTTKDFHDWLKSRRAELSAAAPVSESQKEEK